MQVSVALRGLRVLVVEDEYLIACQEADLLGECGCVVVGPVPSLDEANELAERQRFDVALLDINLADENVFPFAELLARQHIPFAFVTGFSPRVVPRSLSGYPLIRKPFSTDSLIAAIQAALFGAQDHLVTGAP